MCAIILELSAQPSEIFLNCFIGDKNQQFRDYTTLKQEVISFGLTTREGSNPA